ncbi:hypothetical protein GJ698_25805 [Pseudoduganella sp. FT26W]|uniref:Uncharacterized protein n=1 Tax=Duganella aquatilis TaxID=2666082 RepID=A0A844DFV8_9BURK|nr:hypothetical protein [Duganella aquatilis]MRW87490.1 hypothetical protein [Duganella aquatilis]
MLKVVVAVVLGGVLQLASAEKMQTKDQCFAKCAPLIAGEPAFKDPHEASLKKIRAKREGITDPEKLKQLDEEEADQLERFLDKNEKTCRSLCSSFPDTL